MRRINLGALTALVLFASCLGAWSLGLKEAKLEIESLSGERRKVAVEGFDLERLDAQSARLRFAPQPAAKLGGFMLQLLNGDPVRGDLESGSEEAISLRVAGGAVVSFPIESFLALRAADLKDESRLAAPETGDRLWRRVGAEFDRIDGLLLGFTDTGLTFEGQLGEKLYPWSEVAALWIEPLGPAPVFAGDQSTSVELLDGSRLRGQFRGISHDRLTLEVRQGEQLHLPLSSVLEINLDDQRLRFVSELPFVSLGAGGLFGDGFGWQPGVRRDRSVLGGPLLGNGVRYGRGIGVHAPSRLGLDWDAAGILRGKVGLDDSVRNTAAMGSAIFRIYVDGELAFESEELTSKSAPVAMPAIDLAGKKRLEFEVDEASDSVMGDRANWLDLRITQG